MNKEKFISSAIILLIGGIFTKVLGMIIRIATSRMIGTEGLGLYMLMLPTFNLFITIATFGFPISISKLVAEEKYSSKRLIFSLLPLIIIVNILLIVTMIFLAPYLSNDLLKDHRLYYPLLAISLTLPFISISNIIRGYFFGKQKMFPHAFSNVFEQVIRLIIIIFITPFLLKKGITFAITGIVLTNIISELASIIILFFFLPKNFKIAKKDFKPNIDHVKDVMEISLPTTGSRLIGSLGYFLEPIILTQILLYIGYSNGFIVSEYGILSGYVLPTLMMPTFVSLTISSAALPIISKAYINNKIAYVKSKIKQTVFISFVIGFITTILLVLFPDFLLKLFYNTTEGGNYLQIMAPFFLLLYIQSPLTYALQALGKAKTAMFDTLIGIFIKLSIIATISFLGVGFLGLIIANCVNIIIVTMLHVKKIHKILY